MLMRLTGCGCQEQLQGKLVMEVVESNKGQVKSENDASNG